MFRNPINTRQAVPRPPQWLTQGYNYLGVKPVSTVVSAAPAVSACYGSSESDDLQAMVHDFIENDPLDPSGGIINDGPIPGKKLSDALQMRVSQNSALEREFLTEVKLLLLSINADSNLVCKPEGSDCKGGCVKRFIVKHLKVAGYDAAVCKSKWLSSGRVPGGEYEYIDVVFDDDSVEERLIVDVDFQAQFEIARPTQQYEAALKVLPVVYVGSASRLQRILEIMSEAAKESLKQSDMHLPPWRTLDYMSSKWLSTFERKVDPASPTLTPRSYRWQENNTLFPVAKQCGEQLRLTKSSLIAEMKSPGVVGKLIRTRSSHANLLNRTDRKSVV